MATQVQFRGGTTTEHASFNGAAREVTVDTTKQTVVVQDGSTNGGFPLLGEKNADNVKVYFGTGDDLQIYHGSNISTIKDDYGDLRIMGNTIRIQRNAGGENFLYGTEGGKTSLYFDGVERIATASDGVHVTGHLGFNDGDRIQCGTGDDLHIYHDGSHSYLKNTNGIQFINSNTIYMRTEDGSEDYFRATQNGAVELYHNGNKKLNTLANGIQVRGAEGADGELYLYADEGDDYADLWLHKATTDGKYHIQNKASGSWEDSIVASGNGAVELYYDGTKKCYTNSLGLKFDDSDKACFGNASDLQIYHDGNNARFYNTTGVFQFRAPTGFQVKNADASEFLINSVVDGAVELYHDGSKKLETHTNGIVLTGVEGSGVNIYMYADEGDDNADKYRFAASSNGTLYVQNYAGAAWENNITATGNGAVELYYDNSKKLDTNSTGIKTYGNVDLQSAGHVLLEDNGKVKLGNSQDLQIYHDGTDSYISTTTGQLRFFQANSNNTTIKSTGVLSLYANAADDYAMQVHNDGANTNRYGIRIFCGADDAAGTNYALAIGDGNGTGQGYVTFSGGTVSYGTFTAYHPCIVPDSENPSDTSNAYPYGTLLETISIEYTQKNGADTERGIRYKVQKTQSANSRKVLGAYGSSMNGGPDGQTNEHQALILGDGHILVNNAGGNIEVGDGICSSATAGIGQKATANPSMVIGIAQEAITFTGSETKLVAVQYGLQQFTPWS